MKTLVSAWLFAALISSVQAQSQFDYVVNSDNTVTITGYAGTNGILAIPSNFNGLAVTAIGPGAFGELDLNNVTIPSSVTNIGDNAFFYCFYLTNITIPASVTRIGQEAFYASGLTDLTIPGTVTSIEYSTFYACERLTNLVIQDGVTNIGENAFTQCSILTNVTIPRSVSGIGNNAFSACIALTGVFFNGDSPAIGSGIFDGDNNPVIYYFPGTAGWKSPFSNRQALLWKSLINSNLGIDGSNVGFNITGTPYIPVVIQSCADIAASIWTPVVTVTLTNGDFYFSEPLQAGVSGKYYRIVPP